MDMRTSALPAGLSDATPDLKPVAVTRWSARLADPQCERDYRVHRFADDRRRALLMMGLAAVAGGLNFLVELYAYLHNASGFVRAGAAVRRDLAAARRPAAHPPHAHAGRVGSSAGRGRRGRHDHAPHHGDAAPRHAQHGAHRDGGCRVRHLSLSADQFHRFGRARRRLFRRGAVLVVAVARPGAAARSVLPHAGLAAARQRVRLHRGELAAPQPAHAIRAKPAAAAAAVDRCADRHRQPPPLRRRAGARMAALPPRPARRSRC